MRRERNEKVLNEKDEKVLNEKAENEVESDKKELRVRKKARVREKRPFGTCRVGPRLIA